MEREDGYGEQQQQEDYGLYLAAQQEALDRAERQKRQEEEEAALLAQAVQASLVEHVSSEQLAHQIHREEIADADRELASALSASGEQAAQHEALHATAQDWTQRRSEERHHGAWECPQCTLANEPYRSRCVACEAAAPAHVLVYQPIPPARFGLEIEILVPHGIRDGFTLQSLAQQLTRLGPPAVYFRGYSHETSEDWKIVTDSSLGHNNPDQDLCFELVSPILQGEAGLASLRSLMENVRRLGIATNASCGFHVHVDAETMPLSHLKCIAQCFVALENGFDLLVALSWDNDDTAASGRRANHNQYCRSNRLAFGERSSYQRWHQIGSARSKAALVQLVNPNDDRYRKLNLTNIVKPSRPSTCEFRHHGGVEDLPEAEAWVRLILAFCHNAPGPNGAACLLPEHTATPKAEVRALFDLVGCPGLEQFFVVERRLFAEHRFQNEWVCRVCRRRFNNSRSLSQHAAARGH